METQSSKPTPPNAQVPTSGDAPATRAMLGNLRTEILERMDENCATARANTQRLDAQIENVKAELKADNLKLDAKIDNVKAELKADIHAVKAELKADIHAVTADVQAVKAEVQDVKINVYGLKAEMHGMRAHMARIEFLVEDQNARNKIVLDGLTAVLSRQDQIEQRAVYVENTIRELATARHSG